MLRSGTSIAPCGANHGLPLAAEHLDSSSSGDDKHVSILQLQLFSQHPTVDFGTVSVGSYATHYLRAENPTLLTQHLGVDKVPVQDGFSLSADPSLPAAASLNWSSAVAPHSSVLLPITWRPASAGAVSKPIVFKLDDKHRLQVKLLGKAVVQYNQPSTRQTDQSSRLAGQRGVDAAGRKTLSTAPKPVPAHPPAAAAPPPSAAVKQPAPKAAAGGLGPKPASGSTTARAAAAKEPPARFKAPTRSSAAAGGLKLKSAPGPPAQQAAVGIKASAAARVPAAADAIGAAIRMSSASARPSPWQEAASCAGGMVVPATPRGARVGVQQQLAMTPVTAAKTSRGVGLSSSGFGSSSSQKATSSARKTFRFFHTELWMNKQDRAFTGWLNHLLMPYTPEYLRAASEGDTSAALSDLRLAARVQGAMVACYRTDADLRDTMIKVEESIDAGKLRMKPEVVLMGDVVQKRQALEVLMSYNPFWLRLAAEVVTQKPVQMQGEELASPGGAVHVVGRQSFFEAMRSFLLQHFFSDADMAAEMHAGSGAAHYDMDEYTHELGQLVLKRFLLLVLLLDKAATHLTAAFRTPLLFKLTASIKSSRQVVSDFLQSRLVGEGNVLRHLELLGYRLSYSQGALMEYPFAITNLAVDLRDGLRLIKVAEVLTGDTALLQQARFPCDRRPMQLHNTSLALSALQAAGVQLQNLPTSTGLVTLEPKDVIDGDRERTLSLLWGIARTLQLGTVLKVSALRAEVARVLARTRVSGRRPLLPLAASTRSNAAAHTQVPLAVYMHDELLAALQEWVQAVCAAYDVTVQNFTTCFGDGVVLCLLVHYYLPNAIGFADIFITKQRQQEAAARAGPQQQQSGSNQRLSLGSEASSLLQESSFGTSAAGVRDMLLTASNAAVAAANAAAAAEAAAADGTSSSMQWAKGGWAMEFDLAGCGAPEGEDEAVVTSRGVAANFKAVHRAAKALGGVPEMLSSNDFAEHGPDERAVILYVAFLCSRLLECSKDDRAAHIIQTAWRQAKAKTAGMARAHLAKWVAAATVVQRSVRAWLLQRRLHELLQQHRLAAVALQAAWRGRQVRQQQAQLEVCCVRIQREWRRVRAHRSAAAPVIQACWRGHAVRKHNGWMRRLLDRCTKRYEALKQDRLQRRMAATSMQSLWRMQLARRQLSVARAAAVEVQAAWRGHQTRLRYKAMQRAAVTLQAAWRGRQARASLQQMHRAAVALQAVYRGWRVRQAIAESIPFVVKLQAYFRAGRQRAAFLRMRAAAVLLQAAVRGEQERRRYQEVQHAAVVLQSLQRGRQARQELQQQAAAAVVLQSAWRGHAAWKQHQQQRAAAVRIQAAWRGFAAKKVYQQQHAAAVVLQAVWRGRVARQQLQQQCAAAVLIQSSWRGVVQRRLLQQMQAAAVTVQAAVRMHQARRQFQQLCAAAVLLQSSWRSLQARRLLQAHKAAVVVQSHWRRHRAMQSKATACAAAVTVQSAWRGYTAWRAYQELQQAAVVLQAAARSLAARRQLQETRAAAVCLQSAWRARQARQQMQQHQAAQSIQAAVRGWLLRRQVAQQAAAATAIRAAWLAHRQRKSYLHARSAVTAIQATARMLAAQRRYAALKAAAVALQAAWRGLQVRRELAQQQAAAVAVQAAFRCWQQRRAYQQQRQAVISLQAGVRMMQARCRYVAAADAVVGLQAAIRGYAVRKQHAVETAAAVRIQAAFRCWRQQHVYQQQLKAVISVQAVVRMLQARARYVAATGAVVGLQAAIRGYAVRRQQAVETAAAVRIQATFRCWRQERAYQQQRQAVITLQAGVRMLQARAGYVAAVDAVVGLQAAIRGYVVRQEHAAETAAAVQIQAAWRCYSQRCRYLAQHASLVRMQACWRGHRAAAAYKQQLGAAVVLQSMLRGVRARAELAERRQAAAAATALQSAWWARAARKAYRRQRKAALVLQSMVRGKIARRTAQEMRDYINTAKELQKMLLMLHTRSRAATTIQSTWRGWAQRRRWMPVWEAHLEQKQRLQAAVVLQQAWRCSQACSKLQQLKKALPRARACKAWQRLLAAAQQAAWQQCLQEAREQEAALAIQAAYRAWRERRVTAKQLAGVRRFQAIWRGYKVRQRCGRAGRDARRRLAAVAAAAEAAPQRRIGVRTREALDVLLASRQCSQVITAVAAIEFSTRYSKACCKLMVDSSGVSALLAFMRSCNRSKPHVEMLGHALACLANICRWPDLQAGVLMAPDCVMVLSERLQMFRDTEDIFMATVAILSVLVKSDEGARQVAASAPGAMKLWEGICQLLGRKMDMERKYIERLEDQKGSDVTAREATRKMVAAATQLDALQQIVARVDAIAAAHGIQLVHMARPGSAGTTAAASTAAAHQHGHGHPHGPAGKQEEGAAVYGVIVREELVPRSAAAVVQPHMWQPKNTIVRSAYREVSSQVVAQRAAGPLAAAAAVAPVAPTPVVQSMAAAAAAAAAGVGSLGSPGVTNGPAAKTPRPCSAPVQAAAAAGSWSPAAAAAAPGTVPAMQRDTSCLGGGMRSNSSSHNGAAPASPYTGFGSPAHRGSSAGGGGRHSQPETPINNPLMVLQEGAAPEDTLMAAVQQLAEAQTPRPSATPRRSSGQYRRSSTGGH